MTDDERFDAVSRATYPRVLAYDRMRQAIDAALTRHGLPGWRAVDYANDGAPARRDGCASVYVDEPKRQLVISAGLDRSGVDRGAA